MTCARPPFGTCEVTRRGTWCCVRISKGKFPWQQLSALAVLGQLSSCLRVTLSGNWRCRSLLRYLITKSRIRIQVATNDATYKPVALLFLFFVIALVNAHKDGSHGCTAAELKEFTPSTTGSAAANCSTLGYNVGFAYQDNVGIVIEKSMECFNAAPLNFTDACSECAAAYSGCQFLACESACTPPPSITQPSPGCTTCLNTAVPACQQQFNNCSSQVEPVPVKLLVGSVNLNQGASDLNAQIVGSSVGVLCGFTALLVLISMGGFLG